jgi:P27 family predicted phage terminase small subunit
LAGEELSADVRSAWSSFWRSEVAGLVLDADRPALRRLFEYYELHARMMLAFMAEPFVSGSTGQVVANPAAKEIASLEGRIVALEDRFGITPAGRLKLGIVLGAAAKSLEDMNATFLASSGNAADSEDIDPRVASIGGAGSA